MWKKKEGVNWGKGEKEGHTDQIQINILFLWKVKRVVSKRKLVKIKTKKEREREGGRTRQQGVYVGVMKALRWIAAAVGRGAFYSGHGWTTQPLHKSSF